MLIVYKAIYRIPKNLPKKKKKEIPLCVAKMCGGKVVKTSKICWGEYGIQLNQ